MVVDEKLKKKFLSIINEYIHSEKQSTLYEIHKLIDENEDLLHLVDISLKDDYKYFRIVDICMNFFRLH
jgi:hypothetical protein